MKKVITWVAILLVAFIPTYIIIFGGIKTAVPDVSFRGEQLHPAMVQWVSVDETGATEITSPFQPAMDFLFRHGEPTRLANLGELGDLVMELDPSVAVIDLYDLTAPENTPPTSLTLEALRDTGAPSVTSPTQAVLAVEWIITDSIRVQAIYSFEVTP